MENFDPQKAIQTLKDNAVQISNLGKELGGMRVNFILAKSKLMDPDAVARK